MEISKAKQLLSEARTHELLILIHEKTLLGFSRTPRNTKYKFPTLECGVYYLVAPNRNPMAWDLYNLASIFQKEFESTAI
jgi:hypothetical protein